jgi:Reverse transcriptase (RNA-dependent DNA polymerase)
VVSTVAVPNDHVLNQILQSMDKTSGLVSTTLASAVDNPSNKSRTELDSHANMVVCGKHSYVLGRTGRTATVSPFTPDYQALKAVPIVDAALAYDCPYSGRTFILVARNVLHVPSMDNNLVPPFVMREAGLEVKDTPKIHVLDPTIEDHSIWFKDACLRIPLSLWGIFSYFPTRKPTLNELKDSSDILMITPDGTHWDPGMDAYARNEESMLDWEGNLVEPRDRLNLIVDDLPDDDAMSHALQVSSMEQTIIDHHLKHIDPPDDCPLPLSVELAAISSLYDPFSLSVLFSEHHSAAAFAGSIGSTTITPSVYIVDDDSDESDDNVDTDAEWFLSDVDQYFVSSIAAEFSGNKSDATHLSKIWRISLQDAQRTLDVTSKHLRREDPNALSRNYPTNDRMLRYRRLKQYFFMDTFFATKKKGRGKSSRGHTCVQLFVSDTGFVFVVPMKSKSQVPQAMKMFAKEVGAPDSFICDHSGEQTSKEVKDFCHLIGSSLRILEEGTPWANRSELYIGLLKEAVRKDMKESNCPLVLWDYCVERRARINNMTAKNLFQLQGSNAHFTITGEEGDISNLCQFGWYDWCYYRDHTGDFPMPREILGRILGPARGEGNEMAQWVLKANGKVVPRRSCRLLTIAELNSEAEQEKRKVFDQLILKRWGSAIEPPEGHTSDVKDELEPYFDEDDPIPSSVPDYDDPVDANGNAINQQPSYDRMINMELALPQGDSLKLAKVIRRSVNHEGKFTGTYDENPLLNSMTYDVEFPDGEVKEYSANVIAENLLSQVDTEGSHLNIFDCILEHKSNDTALTQEDAYLVTSSGQRRIRKTTEGWMFLVQWKDGSQLWVPLKDMKESHPVETAEYAKARGLEKKPAFAWWVPYTLRKRDCIISAVKTRARKVTHKYGIEIPRSVAHAYDLDARNGNDCWKKALQKEMLNVGIAFEILDDGKSPPIGWSKQSGHIIFDVKMDFTRKARWVLDGHKTSTPEGSTYAGVVSRESVRIALTYAALNGLPVMAADIQNAYLQAPSSQKHYIICGEEFGLENVGKKALIRRALYGGKSAGRDFRNHLRHCMSHLGFKSCPADPDVWMRPAMNADGGEYWEYVLLYVDDVLCVSENAERILKGEIGKYFNLKPSSIGPPDIYLGGKLREVILENGVKAWAFGSSQYVQAAVKNVENYLEQKGEKLPCKALTPLKTTYEPQVDVTPELDSIEAAYYQSLIGILRWMVELGRVDICLEVSMMSSHLAMPRQGHLHALFNIFSYLKRNHNSEIVFDPSDPVVDESLFERRDWTASEFGLSLKEEVPSNMPQPRGMGFVMRAYVDADHAGDTVTRRSRTGFIVYLNSAPVYWLSKKQTGIETSSFGSEFIAMKQCTEYIRGLRYKLRMMGIPCDGPTFVFGDNQSVLANTAIPESILKKKSQSIAYHFVREGCARDEWRTAYVNTHLNPADLLTKLLPSGVKRTGFVNMIVHHVFGGGVE